MSLPLILLHMLGAIGLIWGAIYALEAYAKGVSWKTAPLVIVNVLFWWVIIPISIFNGKWSSPKDDMREEYDFSDATRGNAVEIIEDILKEKGKADGQTETNR